MGLGAAGLLTLPLALEVRLRRPEAPLTDGWRRVSVQRRGATLLGISFRPPQVDALGLDSRPTLQALLRHPFQLVRLGAYWSRMERAPGLFLTDELDWQLDAVERAGKQVILGLGPLNNFSYPEFFVPPHHLPRPLPEGTLVEPSSHPSLLSAATDFLRRVVEHYKDRESIIAWQVEHEAVDPLGAEHSWRLSTSWLKKELETVRDADPSRPIMLNGFLPTSLPVRLSQWWRTRDQGDSLAVAQRLADIVGIDYYPRHALVRLGARSLYLDGSSSPWHARRPKALLTWSQIPGRRLMVSEGQAEPWEIVTVPPNPAGRGMYSCLPEQVIHNYNRWMRWAGEESAPLYAYLFWGAEYWVLRAQGGDQSYIGAFSRILESA